MGPALPLPSVMMARSQPSTIYPPPSLQVFLESQPPMGSNPCPPKMVPRLRLTDLYPRPSLNFHPEKRPLMGPSPRPPTRPAKAHSISFPYPKCTRLHHPNTSKVLQERQLPKAMLPPLQRHSPQNQFTHSAQPAKASHPRLGLAHRFGLVGNGRKKSQPVLIGACATPFPSSVLS